MHVECNTEARSCNHCCCGNGISITYLEYVFVALRMRSGLAVNLVPTGIFF